MLHSINKEQRLYIIKCGSGFSCWGFDVLNNRAKALRDWYFEQEPQAIAQIPDRVGTKKHFAACQRVIAQVARYCAIKHIESPVELSPQLVGLEGKRVEVITMCGEKRRFIVGRSTGWLPAHLEISRSNSHGGQCADKEYKSIIVIK